MGDWQVFDNYEAGNHIFALNAWYSHDIGKVTLLAGLQDVNDRYSTCDASGNLINTSFGGNQVLLSGGNVPTMPCNRLGINAMWNASDEFSWQAGIFDGGVIDLDDGNKFNLKHKLSSSKGQHHLWCNTDLAVQQERCRCLECWIVNDSFRRFQVGDSH